MDSVRASRCHVMENVTNIQNIMSYAMIVGLLSADHIQSGNHAKMDLVHLKQILMIFVKLPEVSIVKKIW